jgi:hypothetical protein
MYWNLLERPGDAKDMATFMEMILKLVFEYPQRVPKPAPLPATGS